MHFGIGILLSAPEMNLSEDEASQFADAAVNVAKHYDVGASAKALAWTDLAMVAGSIYGVRVMQIYGRVQQEKNGGAPPRPGNGHDRPDAPAGGIDLSKMIHPTGGSA